MFEIRDWFDDDELETCPCCGRKSALVKPSGGFRICLDCGLVKLNGERVGNLRAPLTRGRAAA